MNGEPRSLFEKLWSSHVVENLGDGLDLLWIDRHLLHDLSGPFSLKALVDKGLRVHAPELTFATPDHGVSTEPGRSDDSSETSRRTLPLFRRLCGELGIRLFDLGSAEQGIVHVVAPELGLTLPGLTIVCGDSHTCTQGAFGALAWGIGNTEVTGVLAAQALIVEKPRSMRARFDGALAPGVGAKDAILHLIGRHGAQGGAGHAVELAGDAVEALDLEGRMTLCNLALEFGARFALVAPDEKTLAWLADRPFAPQAERWRAAVEHWRGLPSDAGASFDAELRVDVSGLAPQITWGTSPEDVVAVDGRVPSPDEATDEKAAEARRRALVYMGLEAGAPIAGTPVQHVFIGSCANGRLSDLEAAAAHVAGRRVAQGVRAWAVPGSQGVKRAAEARGLDRVFVDAGFAWREPGCSLCLSMNGEQVPAGERCVSTSNRNFVGRQGPGARTHLASPVTAAAAALAGRIVDARERER
jgi:3-isopropylmalate/(R)-2-methylmalate dehydratase large subunit